MFEHMDKLLYGTAILQGWFRQKENKVIWKSLKKVKKLVGNFQKKLLQFEINEFWFRFQTPWFLKKLSSANVREKYDVTDAIKKYFLVENIGEVHWRINIFDVLS